MDDPEAVKPTIHMWTESQLSWFEVEDELPRVSDGTLPHPEKRRP